MGHPDCFADAARFRKLDVDAVRDLGTTCDIAERVAVLVDLDGNLLIAEDPFPGVDFLDGVQVPSTEPGLGVG